MYNFIVCCDRKSKIMVPTCSCSLYQFLIVLQIILLVNTVCSAPTPGDWSTGAGSTFAIPAEETRFRQNDRGAWIGYKDETNDVVYEKTETGKYGEGFVGPAVGYVYHVTDASGVDHRGCEKPFYTSWSKDKLPLNDGQPWIALIKRGGCNFEVKVKNAFEYNAAAVLVYDDNHKDHLDRMKLNTNVERNMSAVFTYKNKGEDIAELVDKGSHVLLNITVGSHFSKPFPNINRTSVLFVSISFIVLMIISLTWLIFYYVQRFRYIHAKDRISRRLCNAAKKALSKIPTKNIKAEDKEIEGDGECCAICIEPYKISDVIRILPCRHEFHKYCIDPWLLEHRTCPMCKMDILKHYGFVYTGSQESILHVEIEEPISTNDSDSPPPHLPNTSPLSQVMTITDHQLSRSSSQSDLSINNSSRATTPDELTPSLDNSHQRGHSRPRQDLCVSCLAASIANQQQPEPRVQHDKTVQANVDSSHDDIPQVMSASNSTHSQQPEEIRDDNVVKDTKQDVD